MAERFGTQVHPSGGLRFGSQTYAAVNASAGSMAAVETGLDVFAALAQPSVHGALGATESGADTFAATGISSLSQTMQAHEAGADSFIASGLVIAGQSYRFGSQSHPLGGVRFGSASWASLGPYGPMAATESGADTAAAVGWLAGTTYSFAIYDVAASFVDYTTESLGAAITGTLDDGYKVMLPISASGITFAWELNSFGNPSLRLSNLTGATNLSVVPWYVWDGTAWTAATFNVSDALQGAAFMVESGVDVFAGNGSNTRYATVALLETGEDFVQISGSVAVAGALSSAEAGADIFAADGAPGYAGDMTAFESGADAFAADGGVVAAGTLAATEAGSDVFASTGSSAATGALAATESGADTFAASASLSSTGSMAATEAATADAFAGSGAVTVTGSLSLTEIGADTFAAVAESERTGALAAAESGADIFSIDGTVAVSGALAAVEENDRFDAVGFREFSGALAAVEVGADRFVARGINGDLVPLQVFDGPVETLSTTRVVGITSRRTAEAA